MDNFISVKCLQSLKELKSHFPDKSFLKPFFIASLKLLVDLSLQIPSVGILHDQTQGLVVVVEEGPFVANNIRNADGSEETNLIERTLFFLLVQAGHQY